MLHFLDWLLSEWHLILKLKVWLAMVINVSHQHVLLLPVIQVFFIKYCSKVLQGQWLVFVTNLPLNVIWRFNSIWFLGVTCSDNNSTFSCGDCPRNMTGDGESCAPDFCLISNPCFPGWIEPKNYCTHLELNLKRCPRKYEYAWIHLTLMVRGFWI